MKRNTLCELVTDREHGKVNPVSRNGKRLEINEHSMRMTQSLTTGRQEKKEVKGDTRSLHR